MKGIEKNVIEELCSAPVFYEVVDLQLLALRITQQASVQTSTSDSLASVELAILMMEGMTPISIIAYNKEISFYDGLLTTSLGTVSNLNLLDCASGNI